jgi:hypothetical protein
LFQDGDEEIQMNLSSKEPTPPMIVIFKDDIKGQYIVTDVCETQAVAMDSEPEQDS